MKNILTYFGIGFTFLGILLGYVIVFGDNIFYTKTYSIAYDVAKPIVNSEILVITSFFIYQLIVFVFFPNLGKLKLIDIFSKSDKIRNRVKRLAILLLAIIFFLLILTIIKKDWNIFTSGATLTSLIALGGIALYFLSYSISPKLSTIGSKFITPVGRFISFFLPIILFVFWLSSIEVIVKGGAEKKVINQPTHMINQKSTRTISRLLLTTLRSK